MIVQHHVILSVHCRLDSHWFRADVCIMSHCHAMSVIMSFHIMLCLIISCHVAASCHLMLSCHVMLPSHIVMSCHLVPCYHAIILSFSPGVYSTVKWQNR